MIRGKCPRTFAVDLVYTIGRLGVMVFALVVIGPTFCSFALLGLIMCAHMPWSVKCYCLITRLRIQGCKVRIMIQLFRGKDVSYPDIEGQELVKKCKVMHEFFANCMKHYNRIDQLQIVLDTDPSEVHVGVILKRGLL